MAPGREPGAEAVETLGLFRAGEADAREPFAARFLAQNAGGEKAIRSGSRRAHERAHASSRRQRLSRAGRRAAQAASILPEVLLASEDRFYARVFALTAAAVLGYFVFRLSEPFLAPAVWAALLAFLLFPANRRLRARFGGRKLAATLLTFGVLLGFVLPAVLAGYAFADQAVSLGRQLSAAAARYRISGVEDLLNLPVVGKAMTWAQAHLDLDPARVQDDLAGWLHQTVAWVVARGQQAILGAFGLLAGIVLMLFLLFFFFRDGDEFAARMMLLVPLDDRRKRRLVARLSDVTSAVVKGTILTAMAQGILVGVGFAIVRLPSPVVFGVLTAIASFVPLVGTALVLVPAVVYLATLGVWWKTIFLLVWGVVVVGSADNVLRPFLISGRAEIGTVAAFVGAVGGLSTFGLVGLFLGPVIVALAVALIQFAEEARAPSPSAAAAPAPREAG
ncbi:MAG TPA: AI-2E family transporter [Thermoanaerobaculia bacterium]